MRRNTHAGGGRRLGASAEARRRRRLPSVETRREGGPPWTPSAATRDIETVVIGAGQAGLSTGYHLAKRGREFVILDAYERVGDNWRCHWDSLRLYSPARHGGLPGMQFPAPRTSYPTKDEMADFLEAYRRDVRAAGPRRGAGEHGAPRGRALRRDVHRRLVVPLRQRGGRDRDLRPYAERAGLRRRAGPGDPPAALERLQAPVAAAARRGAGGRGVALGRGHRLRGRHGRPPGGAQRARSTERSRSGSRSRPRRPRSPCCSSWPSTCSPCGPRSAARSARRSGRTAAR